jgi:Asp-tRNA(Asn)/Glu-tRNA(Gln) amidotransferase A subunit family amidase
MARGSPLTRLFGTRKVALGFAAAGRVRPAFVEEQTLPFNLTGQPALALPGGFTHAGLPVGLQRVGRPFEEDVLLRAGAAYERETSWHRRVPRLVAG